MGARATRRIRADWGGSELPTNHPRPRALGWERVVGTRQEFARPTDIRSHGSKVQTPSRQAGLKGLEYFQANSACLYLRRLELSGLTIAATIRAKSNCSDYLIERVLEIQWITNGSHRSEPSDRNGWVRLEQLVGATEEG